MKKAVIAAIIVLTLLMGTSYAFAVINIDGVMISSDVPLNTSVVRVYFSGTSPFKIYRSLDGQTWGNPLKTGITGTVYADYGRTNYTNYYYKVMDSLNNSAITVAFPPDQNPHGSFAVNSQYCAACHITHTAIGSYLLSAPNSVALCTTCHDGTQSKYDVRSGRVKLATGWEDSSGGPFGPLQTNLPVSTVVYAGYRSTSVATVYGTPTSIHNLGTSIARAPGGVSTRNDGLGCTDCHDAHGNGNYRNLRTVINIAYGVSATINMKGYAQTDIVGATDYGEKIYYQEGSIYFCSACHSDYNQASGSGSVAATITQQDGFTLSPGSAGLYMHAVNSPLIWRNEYLSTKLPLEYGSGVNVIVCITCHHAHGTSKVGVSKAVYSTCLVRLDNQGVCEECHKK